MPPSSHSHFDDPLPGVDVTSVQVFYDGLDAYGTWSENAEFGYVFAPYDTDYVPYSDGHWVETEYGLTWISNAPFGWAVGHYGRWVHLDRWVWVPDTVWGPAWVQWRVVDNLVGWAPLTPQVPVRYWRFVRRAQLFSHNLGRAYISGRDLVRVSLSAHPVQRYIRGADGRHYVAGPDLRNARDTTSTRLRDVPISRLGRFPNRTQQIVVRPPPAVRAAPAGVQRSPRASPARQRMHVRQGTDSATMPARTRQLKRGDRRGQPRRVHRVRRVRRFPPVPFR